MEISIQGVKGAFHEEAARQYFAEDISIKPHLNFTQLVDAVDKRESDYGIIAIENTISGTIHNNLNLIRQSDLHIIGEVYLRIQQNLAVLPGTSIQDLQYVNSHYMAINQCREFFSNFPKIKLTDAEDTALSMQQIAEQNLQYTGGIGSKLAAKYYGLEIIAESIETNKKNYTRFLILEKDIEESSDFNKASLVLFLPHKRGSLANILSIINFYNINLSKIESVPVIGEPWHYMFYLDVLFENTKDYFNMLQAIEPLTDQLNVLGNYQNGQEKFIQKNHYESSRQNQ